MNPESGKSVWPLALLIPCLISILLTSCENSKNDPLFAGTWQFTETINTDGLVFNTVRTIVLTRKSYEETYSVQRENSASFSEIIGTRGDLVLTHSSMVFQLKALGACIRDASDICTGTVQWYSEGSGYWTDNIPFFKETIPGEFEADETTLRLMRDLNTDGDTLDAGEDVVFEKV